MKPTDTEGFAPPEPERVLRPQPFVSRPPVPPSCPKCGNHRTRIVGQSGNPPLVHRRCGDCDHVFSRPRNDGGAPRILVVDDEESVRTFAESALRATGYEVVGALDGPDALRLVKQQHPFDLFVIDVAMPQMSGDELARQLRSADPDVKVLYFTGYIDNLFREKSRLWENEAFVEKPCRVQGLLEAVSLLLFGHTHDPHLTTR